MSAKQTTTTTTTTTRKWNDDKKKKKTGKSVAKAYSAQLKKGKPAKASKSAKRRCPTCGRPL